MRFHRLPHWVPVATDPIVRLSLIVDQVLICNRVITASSPSVARSLTFWRIPSSFSTIRPHLHWQSSLQDLCGRLLQFPLATVRVWWVAGLLPAARSVLLSAEVVISLFSPCFNCERLHVSVSMPSSPPPLLISLTSYVCTLLLDLFPPVLTLASSKFPFLEWFQRGY